MRSRQLGRRTIVEAREGWPSRKDRGSPPATEATMSFAPKEVSGGEGRRLRVLQLLSDLWVGGAQRLVLELMQQAEGSAVEMHFATVMRTRTTDMDSVFASADVPTLHLGARNLVDARALRRLARYIRHHRIDVVHTHLLYADVYGRLAGRFAGVPTVSTLHNVPAAFEGEPVYRRAAEVWTTRYARRLIALSETLRGAFVQAWSLPEERVVVIPNAIRLEPWIRLPPPGSNGPPTVLTVGSLTEQKAQHLLLEAAERLIADRPSMRLVIVGDGPLRGALERRARELGLERHVTFAGNRDDVPSLMAQAHVFVLPSAWEGMPIAAIEAMAAGRAVVLTDVGANAELLAGDESGLLVPPHDVGALARAIDRLLSSGELRSAVGRNARQRAREEYGMTRFFERHVQLYRDVAPRSEPEGAMRGGRAKT